MRNAPVRIGRINKYRRVHMTRKDIRTEINGRELMTEARYA